jgi:hypothetical protein
MMTEEKMSQLDTSTHARNQRAQAYLDAVEIRRMHKEAVLERVLMHYLFPGLLLGTAALLAYRLLA